MTDIDDENNSVRKGEFLAKMSTKCSMHIYPFSYDIFGKASENFQLFNCKSEEHLKIKGNLNDLQKHINKLNTYKLQLTSNI